jgi:calcineurin-like phosphoesterase family protein
MFALGRVADRRIGRRLMTALAVGGLGTVLRADHLPDPDFTIVLIPDTQHYTIKTADPTYADQMKWIRDNAATRRLAFGIHLGDITEDHERTPHEWRMADDAHRILDDVGFPYSIVPGNHDYPRPSGGGQPLRRGLLHYNLYFGPGRFAGRPWYIGHFPSNLNNNNVTFFEAGSRKFMVVSLEYAPTKDAMCWADSVIKSNPDRRAIVATHCYLGDNGRTICGTNPSYSVTGADGKVLWDELLSRHSNVGLTLAGHVNGAAYFRSLRTTGQPAPAGAPPEEVVTEILTDYQSEPPVPALAAILAGEFDDDLGRRVHGNGWLRLLRFVPAENRLYAEPQTTRADVSRFTASLDYPADPTSSPHTFDVPFDLSHWNRGRYSYNLGSPAFFDRTVNDISDGNQVQPRIGMRPTGDFTVVWQDSSRVPGVSYDLRTRSFYHHGCERLPPSRVSAISEGVQTAPAMAIDAQGGYVVTWQDDADGNGRYEILARRYNADGSTRFGDIRVNSVSSGQQIRPAVAVDAVGNFVVVWEDDSNGNGVMQIHARGFRADGTVRFSQRTVNVVSAGQQLRPKIAMSSAGDFVVAWEDDSQPPHGMFNVYARVYNADGSPKTGAFRVNATAAGQQRKPAVAMGQGQFLVAWEDSVSVRQSADIKYRGLDLDGAPVIGEDFISTTTNGPQRAPAVTVDQSGTFYVAWEDDRNRAGGYQILARAIRAGTLGPERTINSNDVGTHRHPSIAASTAVVVVAWEGDLESNGKWEIHARGLLPSAF